MASIDAPESSAGLHSSVFAAANGVPMDGVTDGRAAMQTLINSCASLGLQEIYLGAGTLLMASATVGGATGSALILKGVSVRGAGSGRTTVKYTGPSANLFYLRSDLSVSVIATVTTNPTVGQTNFVVDTTTGFTVGDTVAMRMGQNASDGAEPRQAVFAKVTAIPDGTHLTVDTPAEYTADVIADQANNHQFTRIDTVYERVRVSGIHFEGGSTTRHVIGVQWARHLQFEDLTGVDVGSGIINATLCENVSGRDIYVYRCGSYGNASKGRAISLSGVRSATFDNVTAAYCEGAPIYIESYCLGVLFNGLHVDNRAASRFLNYLVFVGYECDTFIRGFSLSGNASDSVVTYGSGTGQCHMQDTTLYVPSTDIQAFPIGQASGFLRMFDSTGVLRTWNLSKLEKTTVRIDLVEGSTKVAWLRDGFHVAYEVYVSPGVTGAMLTNLSIGRTSVSSSQLPWTAGSLQRSSTFIGGTTFFVPSTFSQATKVSAGVDAASGLPGSSYALITVWSVQYEGAATVAGEPGTEQANRFLPYFVI